MNKAAFEQAWKEVLEEQSAADPTFKKVADSYLAFRKVYKTWATRRRSRRLT
jgi:TRAP-type mannitol/chloroaromatic compound transport system substrate-binding protein